VTSAGSNGVGATVDRRPGYSISRHAIMRASAMVLQAGTRLGPFEVVSLIGAGGMGEVYRARDTRLDRLVAVKVLAPQLAGDSEFRARFTREAKTISALNHAHICGLYDIGRDQNVDYLVLELLEGETLAARLARGALPLAQVLRFGIEIADALEAAHRHGIVHRDLKPGNVMVTAAGT
jgi:serine/threonine protein kinase